MPIQTTTTFVCDNCDAEVEAADVILLAVTKSGTVATFVTHADCLSEVPTQIEDVDRPETA